MSPVQRSKDSNWYYDHRTAAVLKPARLLNGERGSSWGREKLNTVPA